MTAPPRSMSAHLSPTRTRGWSWQTFPVGDEQRGDFWLGRDPEGQMWLTKLRGSFAAYREIVFGSLAARLGWSCQRTRFIVLDAVCAELLGRSENEVHGAHVFYLEHPNRSCDHHLCPIPRLQRRAISNLSDFTVEGLANFLDKPRSEIASCVFGGMETPDFLVTTKHEVLIIDSESMFHNFPVGIEGFAWLHGGVEKADPSTMQFVASVCEQLGSLSERDIDVALNIPSAIEVDVAWPIRPIVERGIEFARDFASIL
jgi:hypothetical protein